VARYLCDRIGVMFFGRLVEVGRTEEAFARPRHPYTRALLSTLDEEFGVDITIEPPLPARGAIIGRAVRLPRRNAFVIGQGWSLSKTGISSSPVLTFSKTEVNCS
jgi:ABC-type glutathione transport system ATPase component